MDDRYVSLQNSLNLSGLMSALPPTAAVGDRDVCFWGNTGHRSARPRLPNLAKSRRSTLSGPYFELVLPPHRRDAVGHRWRSTRPLSPRCSVPKYSPRSSRHISPTGLSATSVPRAGIYNCLQPLFVALIAVTQDYVQAHMWFKLAGAQPHAGVFMSGAKSYI